MSTSVVPALIDALVAAGTTALPSTIVSDGVPVTDDPGDFLMVGIQDPDAETPLSADSAEAQQSWGAARPRTETGSVYCCAYSWNGNGDAKAARNAVYAIAAAVANALRPNDLAVPGLQGVGYGTSTTFRQGQSDYGAGALLMFSVEYAAHI